MIKDLVDSYLLAKSEVPTVVFDSHLPKDGLYIRLRLDQSWEEQFKQLESNYLVITDREFESNQQGLFEWFRKRDYLSSLISMNKPVDTGKQLHSNNPFTLFAKKDVFLTAPQENGVSPMVAHLSRFLSKTMPLEVLRKWDELLGIKKSASSKSKQKSAENNTETLTASQEFFLGTEYGPALKYLVSQNRLDRIQQVENWYRDNLSSLFEKVRDIPFKNYIKIFFTSEDIENTYSWDELYEFEYLLYTIPKIFIDNSYNLINDGTLTGVPSFNLTMNSKKPYFQHKTMRTVAPVRMSLEQALIVKETSEWLLSQPKNRTNKFAYQSSFTKDTIPAAEGYYQVFVDPEDNVVKSYENVPFPMQLQISIPLKNPLRLISNDKLKDYGYLESVEELQQKISKTFFCGRMKDDFLFREPQPREGEFTHRMATLFQISKEGFYDWFYKGTTISIRPQFARVTFKLIEELLFQVEPTGHERSRLDLRWLADAMNVRLSLIAYLEGVEQTDMASRILVVSESLKEKLTHPDESYIETDDEFYYLAGQITFYLKTLSGTQQKKGDLLAPFFMAKRSAQLKRRIEEAYHLHRDKILLLYSKLNWSLANVQAYQPDKEFQHEDSREMFMAGLFSNNWFWEKGTRDKSTDIEENENVEEN